MSNANVNIGKELLTKAYALGNVDDPALPPHLQLYNPTTTKGEQSLPKFICHLPACKAAFLSQEELIEHQWQKLHYYCRGCERDYPDEESLGKHNSLNHKESQDLVCPGCGVRTETGAQLIGHVERGDCPRIFPSFLHKRRQEQIEFNEALRKMNPANEDFVLTGDMRNMSINDAHRPHTKPDSRIPSYMHSTNDFPELDKELSNYRSGNSQVPDLLTGDVISKPIAPPVRQVENQWYKRQSHSSAAGPAIRPTPRQLETLSIAAPATRDAKPNGRITDPEDPRFNAAVYYHPILEQFACPHGCKKKYTKATALIAHLKSAAHREAVTFKCPRCLRNYKTMASALAHAENASRICNIRETDEFRKFVDHITGGMLDGLNDKGECLKDGRPRIIIPKAFYESLPLPSHVGKVRDEQLTNLGRGRMAEWEDDRC